ncbi:MAG: polyphosphate kinase 2 [Cyclobacteriaceae bacterium]|nr:polyphosphate kinase 2 [Cyclobacteriaceae bacterium]
MKKIFDKITERDLRLLNTKQGKIELLRDDPINLKKALRRTKYLKRLIELQEELIKMQQWAAEKNKRIAILFEGRDAAGKGGAIRRFIEHMNPRLLRVVALPEPTPVERGQWYFQRYVLQLPSPGEIVFFNRSWYNRAVVEPVNGYCTQKQYREFMAQIGDFEHMLRSDGIQIIKFWFSITKDEQEARFKAIREDPLKQWKLSPVDDRALELWDDYTYYKNTMFSRTSGASCPWHIIQANTKAQARIEAIKHVLRAVDYPKDSKVLELIEANPKVIDQVDPKDFARRPSISSNGL